MAKRDSHNRMMMTVSKNTADILDGIDDLSSWDDEELLRGQRRNKHGKFSGTAPKVVPTVVHQEIARRQMSQAYDLLRVSTLDALMLLDNVINDLEAPLNLRIEAAKVVVERTIPKNDTLNLNFGVQEDPPWLKALHGALSIVPGDARDEFTDDDIIDVDGRDSDFLIEGD